MRWDVGAGRRAGSWTWRVVCVVGALTLMGPSGCVEATKSGPFERELRTVAVARIAPAGAPDVAAQTSGTLGDLHVRATRDGLAPYDTVVPFPAGVAVAEIGLAVPVLSTNSNVTLTFELRVNAQRHYAGEVNVSIANGVSSTPPPVVLAYVGPVQSVVMPADTLRVTELDTTPFAATLRDVAGYPVTGRTVTYTSSSPAVATVSAVGTVSALQAGVTTITATSEGKSATAVVAVDGLFISLTLGGGHSCGLTARGVAYCWGFLAGDDTPVPKSRPTRVAGGHVFGSLRSGQFATCGVTTTGAGLCWGVNFNGHLGDGTIENRNGPVAVVGGHSFSDIAPGVQHTCGRTTAGPLYCWGWNEYGQLGDGTNTESHVPVQVQTGVAFARPVTGGYHSCALTTAGVAYCWGQNFAGQLGDGTTSHQPFPTSVLGGHTFTALSSGLANQVTCGVAGTGAAYCWGWNDQGQLGDGTFADQSVPSQVSGGLTFLGIATGAAHTCGWTSGAAYCWGRNPNGQLGTGATIPSGTPIAVSSANGFRDVAAGGDHTCARDRFGAAFCWGANNGGQLGDGTNTQRLTPVRVLLPLN